MFFHRLHNGVWLFIEKVCQWAPPSIHNQFGMLHSGPRGSQSAAQLTGTALLLVPWAQLQPEKLARPVCCVYVRNSVAVGGAGWVCTLPGILTARITAEICKAGRTCASRGVGKCPQGKGKGVNRTAELPFRITVASRGEFPFPLPW